METNLFMSGLPFIIMMIQSDDDRQFITDIYFEHRALMHKVASRYFSPDSREAEDALSDTIVRLCKSISTIKGLACHKIAPYIVKVSRSACIDLMRGRLRQATASEEVLRFLPDEDAEMDKAMSRPYALDILASFTALSKRDKEVIRMRHIDQMPYEQIADALGISEQGARAAVSRAQRRLQEEASRMDPEELP